MSPRKRDTWNGRFSAAYDCQRISDLPYWYISTYYPSSAVVVEEREPAWLPLVVMPPAGRCPSTPAFDIAELLAVALG
jgi:hypothetical protein